MRSNAFARCQLFSSCTLRTVEDYPQQINMQKSKTVLVQINSLDLGGTQINAIDLAKAVEGYGFRSVLFGPWPTLPKAGPNVMEVSRARGVRLEGYWPAKNVLPCGAGALAAKASRIGADIVHVYGAYGDPRSAYWGPCLGGRRPFVHTVYEMAVDRRVYRNTSLVIGTSYLRDELAGRPGPTTLISPPVDIYANAPDPAKRNRFRATLGELGTCPLIVVISRLDREMKSFPVETAIRAMTSLTDTGAVLVIVGSGTEEERLKEIGRSVNAVTGRTLVHFTGAMSDPCPAYAAADIMLGMGGSAARSLAFAAPLIVQGELGTAELFEQETSASLFRRSFWNPRPEQDPAGVLAELVRQLLDNPARRIQLGQYGRRFAIDNFSLASMAERLATVYEKSFSHYSRVAWLRDLPGEMTQLATNLKKRLSRGCRLVTSVS